MLCSTRKHVLTLICTAGICALTVSSGFAGKARQTGIDLRLPKWSLNLDSSNGLRAVSWSNGLTGGSLNMGAGPELEVDVDTAYKRILIEGWRFSQSQAEPSEPDQETGYRAGYHDLRFDDSSWGSCVAPNLVANLSVPQTTWVWTRTHVFLPDDCRDKDVTLALGSFGVHDYQYMRVFVNGHEMGVRRALTRWFEPAKIVLTPGSDKYKRLRFGQDNVIALQLSEFITRTKHLDKVDTKGAHCFLGPGYFTPPYEQYVAVGAPCTTPILKVASVKRDKSDKLQVKLLSADKKLSASITYRSAYNGAVVVKSTTLINKSTVPLRVMNIRLGTYKTQASVSDGEMGFPVYLDDQFFASLAHPAGWATGEDGVVKLRQYPGVLLAPGQSFRCMDAVYGAARQGEARDLFLGYLKQQMRRTVRGHVKPYAIFETFGGWDGGFNDITESYCLGIADAVEEYGKQTNEQFDIACLEFWHDPAGDLTRFKPQAFPQGFDKLRDRLTGMGISPGLWIDNSDGEYYCIAENPVVASCRTDNAAYSESARLSAREFCRAADPFRSIFTNAFVYHARENKVRLFKFDGLRSVCYNVNHEHMPGLYSPEAIYNSVIETLQSLDKVAPDALLMLYWGYRSPWWLVYGDTIFEAGIFMEAASPSPTPSLYVRDGVALTLDRGKAYAEDVPALGKDSLGIWLSDWGWNSCIGKERWQEGMVIDMCRGTIMLQPWTDSTWLTVPERAQFAEFLNLLRSRPECFVNSKLVIGSPWKHESYGYACADGQRGFVVVNNCVWQDRNVELKLDSSWGLNGSKGYHLYRRYPDPAQLVGESEEFRGSAKVWMRPFEVALFELVPTGEKPTGTRVFEKQTISPFGERTTDVAVTTDKATIDAASEISDQKQAEQTPLQSFDVTGITPATEAGGILFISVTGGGFEAKGWLDGSEAVLTPVLSPNIGPGWQAWRIKIPSNAGAQPFKLNVKCPLAGELAVTAYFIPAR